MEKMNKIELCVRFDPSAPPSAMPTTKIIKKLKNFFLFPDVIENKLVELKILIEGCQDTLVPPILDAKKYIKKFTSWRDDAISQVNNIVKIIAKDMNMELFQEFISKLVNYELFYENFERKVTQATVNYNPYR